MSSYVLVYFEHLEADVNCRMHRNGGLWYEYGAISRFRLQCIKSITHIYPYSISAELLVAYRSSNFQVTWFEMLNSALVPDLSGTQTNHIWLVFCLAGADGDVGNKIKSFHWSTRADWCLAKQLWMMPRRLRSTKSLFMRDWLTLTGFLFQEHSTLFNHSLPI